MGLRVNWMGQRKESEKLNNRENVGGRGTVFGATNDLISYHHGPGRREGKGRTENVLR